MQSRPTFDELIREGERVPVDGWDFSWFAGRATEQRPAWASELHPKRASQEYRVLQRDLRALHRGAGEPCNT